jgi:hypothetical protein
MAKRATPGQLDADNSSGVDITPLVSIGAARFPRRFHVGTSSSGSLKMPDIRLQVFPQPKYIGHDLAVGGESIYDLLGGCTAALLDYGGDECAS